MQNTQIQALADFLIKYISALISAGTYTARVAKCAGRIANAYDFTLNLNFFYHHTSFSLVDNKNFANTRTYIIPNHAAHPNFAAISALSALSWQIADEKPSLDEANKNFIQISQLKRRAFYTNIIISPIAFGAFCKLFGGDLSAMLIVLLATFFGMIVRLILAKIDIRLTIIAAAFISSLIAALLSNFSTTPDIAIGSSILYLIPGVFFINSIIDILRDHILMGISRIVNVAIIVVCISIGLFLTLAIMGEKAFLQI